MKAVQSLKSSNYKETVQTEEGEAMRCTHSSKEKKLQKDQENCCFVFLFFSLSSYSRSDTFSISIQCFKIRGVTEHSRRNMS